MKKISVMSKLMIALATLFMTFNTYAADASMLVGRWRDNSEYDLQVNKIVQTEYNFNFDGTYTEITYFDDKPVFLDSGTYTVDGDKLTLNLTEAKMRFTDISADTQSDWRVCKIYYSEPEEYGNEDCALINEEGGGVWSITSADNSRLVLSYNYDGEVYTYTLCKN